MGYFFQEGNTLGWQANFWTCPRPCSSFLTNLFARGFDRDQRGGSQHGLLDQKGCVIELQQRNTEVTIPFIISNRKYGFLWNNPSIGRVELGRNATRWVAEGSQQLDYYIVCGETHADILERYGEVAGRAPNFPAWASGNASCAMKHRKSC